MQFGELLKEHIKKQNLTVYQIAKETGIDRSFLQGVLSGKRKLPKKRFADIVNSNYFTVKQVHELCEKYFLERFGKDKIERFEVIEKGIKGKIKNELNEAFSAEKIDIKKGTSFYSGKKEVSNVIYTVLSEEKINNFASNFDFSDFDINRIVYNACKNGTIKDFFHCVTPDSFSSIHNIEIVFNSMHYAEAGYITYISAENSANSIMPYFIIADNHFILYDEKGENCIVFSTDIMLPYLKQKADHIKNNCRQFISIMPNAFEFMNAVKTITVNSTSHVLSGIDNQFCPTFLTPEIIEAIATPAVKNLPSVIQQLISHYQLITCKKAGKAMVDFLVVTYNALSNFVKYGWISGFPKALANPVPKEMRAQLLKAMIDENNIEKLILTNPNMFSSEYDFNFQINDNYLLLISSEGSGLPDDFTGKIIFSTDNSVIVDDFNDFIDYMIMSEKTYTTKVSTKIVESFIDQLEAEL